MKKIVLGFAAVFVLLLLANCTTQTRVPEHLKREWMLVEFQNFSKDLMVKNKAHLNLSTINHETPGRFSAKMGCNNMFGQATFNTDGTVKFSGVASTMMYCDKNMELEAAFGKELPNMVKYKIDGHQLTLTDANGKQMKFVAADWD